jgi:hypothetical protein
VNTFPRHTVPWGSTHLHDELPPLEEVVDVVSLPAATCSKWEPDRMLRARTVHPILAHGGLLVAGQ